MNEKLQAKLAKQELQRRQVEVIPDVLQSAFKEQLDFIKDPSKRKASCSSRRAGKSSAVGLYLVSECLNNPSTNCLYIAKTKSSAENIMWNDIFDVILKQYEIKAVPGTSKLQIKFENGSVLYLTGADANKVQMRKLVGKKYRLVVIDECQYFENDLEILVNKILTPTLADFNGTMCMIGTPGDNMTDSSYWYKVASGRELGWKLHPWHWKQNPHVRNAVQKQVDEMIAANPLVTATPWFRQEYNNEWVPNTDARVYYGCTHDNYIEDGYLQPWFYRECIYNLQLDLGYVDATAYVITAYNQKYDRNMYVLESFKKTKQIITDVAQEIKLLRQKYNFQSIIVDAANLQAVEEMRRIHALPLTAADKQGKAAHIALINSDFITKNIFILKSKNQQLMGELDTLIWDAKALLKGQQKEDQTKENHLTDALLYGHHQSRHYWFKAVMPPLSLEEQVVADIEKQFLAKPKQRVISASWWDQEPQ